jgi:hypothetical protein
MATTIVATKEKLAGIVGKDNVLDLPEDIARYGRDFSLELPRPFMCVVRPSVVSEAQRIIQLANEAKFAVVPQSSGVHFNGGAVPKESGVVLDLSRMNRITEVDVENKIAHIQVGVTWEQLQNELETRGYRSIIPLLPHSSRSVITDWLEREQPVVQNLEYSEPLLSLQIIWGNGELFVSGSASIHSFRNAGVTADGTAPLGPGPMSYATFLTGSQGTMGVVTWATVQFEPMPTLTKAFFIPTDRADDVIEPIYKILRRRIGYECLVLNNINLANILTETWPEQFAQFRSILPPWTIILFLGALKRRSEERIAYEEEALRDIITSNFPELSLLTGLPGMSAVERRLPEMLRKPWPKDKAFWKHAYKGGCQDLVFMTTLDRVAKFVPAITEVASKYQYPSNDIGTYIQPVQNGRACQVQFSFYYNPDDKVEKERIGCLYCEAAAAALQQGAYFNRPYPTIAEMVYRKHGDYATLLKRFKKHFDPNNIMNPGNLCF